MDKKIFERELSMIVNISKEFGVRKVLLFGSCLEDIASAHDIDIAVSGITPKDFFKYYGKIAKLIEHDVDIIDLDDAREHLYKRILAEGNVIYEKPV